MYGRRAEPGVSEGELMGRRHARPEDVMPRHVVLGFLESDRLMEDSGVFAMKGMLPA